MTISHYYKCDFCGEKRYISSIDEAQSLKCCPYCQNDYAPFNLTEQISPDLVLISKESSSYNCFKKQVVKMNFSDLFAHSSDNYESNSESTNNSYKNNTVAISEKEEIYLFSPQKSHL